MSRTEKKINFPCYNPSLFSNIIKSDGINSSIRQNCYRWKTSTYRPSRDRRGRKKKREEKTRGESTVFDVSMVLMWALIWRPNRPQHREQNIFQQNDRQELAEKQCQPLSPFEIYIYMRVCEAQVDTLVQRLEVITFFERKIISISNLMIKLKSFIGERVQYNSNFFLAIWPKLLDYEKASIAKYFKE